MAALSLRAFAKINLGLRVHPARGDGFHDIQTIFQTIDLHDRLTFEARRGAFEIRCAVPGVPLDRGNLVWEAARQLWAAAGREGEPRGTVVTIDKRIPMQGGLGGGSSDAAAALLGLQRLWKLELGPRRLHAIAADLGSDVPYFLIGGTALGLGRGDVVHPLEDLPRLSVVLVLPPFGVATKEAYAWVDRKRGNDARDFPRRDVRDDRPLLPAWLGTMPLGNDFEDPVFERHPALRILKGQLEGAGAALAAMSGSGSTMFGVFASAADARKAARAMRELNVEVRVARFQPRKKARACP
jgi:4-diphosphocytidyl-2-C-methyl-D-erythritol kinase